MFIKKIATGIAVSFLLLGVSCTTAGTDSTGENNRNSDSEPTAQTDYENTEGITERKEVFKVLDSAKGDKTFISTVENLIENPDVEISETSKVLYISPDGNDENDGSEDFPFQTFSYALTKLTPGTTLYVKSGTYDKQIKIKDSVKGEENAWITIAPDPKNTSPAIISGENFQDDFELIKISGAEYLRITGLTIANSNGEDAAGIQITPPSNHIIIDNCYFTNIKAPDPEENGNVANGIVCFGNSNTKSINNIMIYKNSFYDLETGWGECITASANSEYIFIIENTVNKTGNIGIDVGGNYGYCPEPSLDFARYVYIYGNDVSNCESAYGETAYGIYADGGQHIQIINNIVTDCSGGIEAGAEEPQKSEDYATCDILIKGNTITGSESCGLSIGGYELKRGMVKDVTVTGNTFINNANKSDGAIVTLSKCDDITITGNTFTHEGSKFKGIVLYKEFENSYPKTFTMKDNVYNGLESADSE